MANRDLLAEAIADAKAVKATAIANAKAALEEAFTPHLKSMLAAKLEEMDRDDDVKEEELEEMDAVSFRRKNSPSYEMDPEGGPVNPVPHKAGKSTVQEDDLEEEFDLDEMLSELDLDESISEEVTEEIDEDLTEAEEEESEEEEFEEEESEEGEGEMEEEEIDLEDMSEDDLKSFIEDVIKDMVSAGELEAGEEFEAEDEMEMGDEEIDMEDDSEEIMENEEVDMEEGYSATDEMDGTPIDEEELEEVVDPVTVAAGVAALLGGSAAMSKMMDKAEAGGYGDKAKKLADFLRKSGKAAGDTTQQRNVTEEETLNEEPVSLAAVAAGLAALLGGTAGLSKAMDKAEAGEYGDKAKKLAAMLRKGGKAAGDATQQRNVTEEDFTDTLAEIEELKRELQEVNLLNAKLLYSNKIFRTKNLSEDKKVKVLKAFDRAASVKDAKVIFDTLNENLNSKEVKKSMVSEIKSSASKSAGVATQAKQPIVENDAFRRMQQLAGIIKEN